MKKLPVAIAFLSLTIAAPVFACPHDSQDQAPRTADKAKDAPSKEKTKEAKPAKADDKKPADKVSQR